LLIRIRTTSTATATESAVSRSADHLWAWRLALTLVVALAIGLFSAGLATYLHDRDAHARAGDSLARAERYAERVHERVGATRRTRAELERELQLTTAARVQLRHAEAGGFAVAVEAGRALGERAGTTAGTRAGTRDGRAQRSRVSAPGWYYAHVTWHGALPRIGESYDVDAGASHAYWVESGKAVERSTG
jgi:hypothetical protein